MTLLQIIVLAIVQGLTEFLPVSSSAHLVLASDVMGWPDQGLVLDAAVHLGTLLAVLVYFRADLWRMLRAIAGPAEGADVQHRHLAIYLALASLPVLLTGFLAAGWIEVNLRNPRIIAYATLAFGLLLWLADALGRRHKVLQDIAWRQAGVIGLAQMLALIPGVSRSGITMTAARALGFGTDAAARFSFLLAIPVIGAAGAYGLLKMATVELSVSWSQFALAVLFSALAGWLCIDVFLRLLRRVGLFPFVIYRLLLGLLLLWWL